MKQVLAAILFLLVAAGTSGANSPVPPLRIATGELPPYATESRPDKGIALAIVKRAFELSGHQVEFHFLPWTRAQVETKLGHFDASAHWGASEERRRDFLLSDNILSEQWLIVHRREIKLRWATLTDLRRYALGYVRDYTYTPEFWSLMQKGELQGDSTPDDRTGLRKLLLGRIDAMPMERNVACDLLLRHFSAAEARDLTFHPRLLTDKFTTHLILPPQVPRSKALLADFNRGLRKLKESGEYARIQKSVNCPIR